VHLFRERILKQELLDSTPVIRLIDKPWQLKITHLPRTRRRPFRSSEAFTTQAMSMRCRIFTAVK